MTPSMSDTLGGLTKRDDRSSSNTTRNLILGILIAVLFTFAFLGSLLRHRRRMTIYRIAQQEQMRLQQMHDQNQSNYPSGYRQNSEWQQPAPPYSPPQSGYGPQPPSFPSPQPWNNNNGPPPMPQGPIPPPPMAHHPNSGYQPPSGPPPHLRQVNSGGFQPPSGSPPPHLQPQSAHSPSPPRSPPLQPEMGKFAPPSGPPPQNVMQQQPEGAMRAEVGYMPPSGPPPGHQASVSPLPPAAQALAPGPAEPQPPAANNNAPAPQAGQPPPYTQG